MSFKTIAGESKSVTGDIILHAWKKNPTCLSLRKLKNQDGFKGVKRLLSLYRAQLKSWMSAELFEDWVTELDRKFDSAKRKIVLMIDDCTSHLHVKNLEGIELILIPPNTMSHTQPLDQGVIRALKTKYHSLAVCKRISDLAKKKPKSTISILSTMIMLTKSWHVLSDKTFTNCFKIAGISGKEVERVHDNEDDSFPGLNDIE